MAKEGKSVGVRRFIINYLIPPRFLRTFAAIVFYEGALVGKLENLELKIVARRGPEFEVEFELFYAEPVLPSILEEFLVNVKSEHANLLSWGTVTD